MQISELKEKTANNKALNDKKRLAQSYANLASSRWGLFASPNVKLRLSQALIVQIRQQASR